MASGKSEEHPVLETRNLTIRFGGHVAVDRVSCAFRPGTLTAIVGPNGAGKTTYFNLISGQLRATAGSVALFGEGLQDDGLHKAFVLQHHRIVVDMREIRQTISAARFLFVSNSGHGL